MRLRPLTEAECYARCYGGRREETVSILRLRRPRRGAAPADREPTRGRRRSRGGRPHDPRLRELDVAPPLRAADEGPPAGAAAERVDVHGDVDVACATLSAAWPNPPLDVPDVLAPEPPLRLLRHQPGPRLGRRARALRESAQRLLAPAPRRRLHAAALRARRAARSARARLRRHERRLPDDARLGRPAPRRLRRRAAGAGRPRAEAARDRVRRQGGLPRRASASGQSSGRSCGRSARRRSSSCPRPRRRTPRCPYPERLRWFRALHEWLEPVPREAVRALVVDAAERVLLLRFENPVTHDVWWATPGGGIEPGESDERGPPTASSPRRSASRVDDPGPVVWQRVHVFPWDRQLLRQTERFHLRPRRRARRRARRST